MKKAMIVLAVLGALLVSCASDEFTTEDSSFREVCLTNGDPWMKMSETKEGRITGPSCYGCMPDANTHLCSLSEYDSFRSGGRGDVEGADAVEGSSDR